MYTRTDIARRADVIYFDKFFRFKPENGYLTGGELMNLYYIRYLSIDENLMFLK